MPDLVEQPATPESTSEDWVAPWARGLPSIRVVGRGTEERVHGGTAALEALRLSRTGDFRSPFENHQPASPAVADFAPPAAGMARSAPSAVPAKSRGAAPKGRSLYCQDSASSIGCMGAGVQRLSLASLDAGLADLDDLPTPTSPTPPCMAAGLSQLQGVLVEAGAATAWVPDSLGLKGARDSMRVHGSCDFSALQVALGVADASEGSPVSPASPAAAAIRKLGPDAVQQRLRRLDSGMLAGQL